MNPDELVKQTMTDVINIITEKSNVDSTPILSASDIQAIGEAELRRDKPRKTIIDLCKVTPESEEVANKIVETLVPNANNPYCMVICGDQGQHFLQFMLKAVNDEHGRYPADPGGEEPRRT